MPGVLSGDEIEELSQEYDALFERKKKEKGRILTSDWLMIEVASDWSGKMEAMWTGDWAESSSNTSVLSIHNLQLHSSVFTRLLLHQKMMDAVMDLMENCVNTKVTQFYILLL